MFSAVEAADTMKLIAGTSPVVVTDQAMKSEFAKKHFSSGENIDSLITMRIENIIGKGNSQQCPQQ